jgi:catechol 2,3-dioxygenase-like lactoylglutathione lyase family enzyme
MNVQRLSHIGICVSDLEHSVAFYRDALGFEEISRLQLGGAALARLLQLESGALQAVYLQRDGTRIELLHYPQDGHHGGDAPAPMNRLGLTHLSLRVADLDAAVAAVKSLGGACIDATRIENDAYQSKVVFVTDPDGLRIELLQAPGDPNALPGA